MKYDKKTYEHVWAEWLEGRYDEKTDRRYTDKNHDSNCTVIDSSRSYVTIVFSEGDSIKKAKRAAGFRIQGVKAVDFFSNPGKYKSIEIR